MNLFETVQIKSITLKNRIIRSATYEGGSDKEGNPTDYITRLYQKLADGDVGAIITGYVGVNHQGRTTESAEPVSIPQDEQTDRSVGRHYPKQISNNSGDLRPGEKKG